MDNFKLEDSFIQVYRLTESVYGSFIEIFQDNNPLHTSEEYAIKCGFKGKVMHGNILNGFLSHFIGECLPVKNVIIHSQEIRYRNAVYLNDELLFTAQITGIYESVNAIEFKFTFKNNASSVVAQGKFQIGLLN